MDSLGGGPRHSRRRAPLGVRVAFAIVPRVPRWFALRVADLAGDVASLVAKKRHAVHDNLRQAVGSSDLRSTTREIFRTQARNYADLLQLVNMDRETVTRLVQLVGEFDLLDALAEGHGAILVSGHVGNLDVVAQRIASLGHPITAVAERVEPPELLEMLTARRSLGGMRLVFADNAAGDLVRALKAGGAVYLSADLDVRGGGALATFFGAAARVPDAYARLARKRGTPLFFAAPRRLADGAFVCSFERVPLPAPTSDTGADVALIVASTLSLLEAQIRSDPGQWIMFRPMWD